MDTGSLAEKGTVMLRSERGGVTGQVKSRDKCVQARPGEELGRLCRLREPRVTGGMRCVQGALHELSLEKLVRP